MAWLCQKPYGAETKLGRRDTAKIDLPPAALSLFFCRGEGSEPVSVLFSEEAATPLTPGPMEVCGEEPASGCECLLCLMFPGTLYSHTSQHLVFSNSFLNFSWILNHLCDAPCCCLLVLCYRWASAHVPSLLGSKCLSFLRFHSCCLVALQPQLSDGFKESYDFVVSLAFSHCSSGWDAHSSFLHPNWKSNYSVVKSLEIVALCVVVYLIQ